MKVSYGFERDLIGIVLHYVQSGWSEERENDAGEVPKDDAYIAVIEARSVLSPDDLVHAWMLPSSRSRYRW